MLDFSALKSLVQICIHSNELCLASAKIKQKPVVTLRRFLDQDCWCCSDNMSCFQQGMNEGVKGDVTCLLDKNTFIISISFSS